MKSYCQPISGVTERGTNYAFQVTASNSEDQSGSAKAYITVRSGPTSCEFTVDDYEELTDVSYKMFVCGYVGGSEVESMIQTS